MSKAPAIKTVDFGAPDAYGAHVFRVEIPVARTGDVKIVEDYGFRGESGGVSRDEERVVLKRATWTAISDIVRREFNDRLKTAKVSAGRWHSGTNLVDRLLGRELCVLAWAAETAEPDLIPIIVGKWSALRPEERWWLFAQTCAEAGLTHDTNRGWRKALFHALSDGEQVAERKRRPRPVEPAVALPLFKEAF
jgi:hypothetical protein